MLYIESMLSGKIEMTDFINNLISNKSSQESLDSLIPAMAINNSQHDVWNKYSYDNMVSNDFSIYKVIQEYCYPEHTIADDLNIFGVVEYFYGYHYPNFEFTTKYHDQFSLYINLVATCFLCKDVKYVIDNIIKTAFLEKTKKKKIEIGKALLNEAFHITDNKKPRWIQGSEWPMGLKSPMKFISQKRRGEYVEYYFVDVDTQEEQIITQYY